MNNEDFSSIYNNQDYATKHEGWHFEDTEAKIKDISLFSNALVSRIKKDDITIADIGTGMGGVLNGFVKQVTKHSGKQVEGIAFEISEFAVSKGKQMFPELKWNNRELLETDGPYDVVMFIDVLEHLENPWQLLRMTAKISRYMLIRQPLLDNYSNYRTDNYKSHRDTWGHIAFFNYRSFIDMAIATGWNKCDVKLVAPWELNTGEKKIPVPFWKTMLSKYYREHISYFVSGFYLNGLFESKDFSGKHF